MIVAATRRKHRRLIYAMVGLYAVVLAGFWPVWWMHQSVELMALCQPQAHRLSQSKRLAVHPQPRLMGCPWPDSGKLFVNQLVWQHEGTGLCTYQLEGQYADLMNWLNRGEQGVGHLQRWEMTASPESVGMERLSLAWALS